MVFGSAFLAGAVVFEEKHAQTEAMSLGSAFSAGAFVFRGTMSREKAMSLGLPFLAGALVFLGKKTCPDKSYVSRIGVPSRGFVF